MNWTRVWVIVALAVAIPLVVSMFVFPGPWLIFLYVLAISAGLIVLSIPVKRFILIHHSALMLSYERHTARWQSYHHSETVIDVTSGAVAVPAIVKQAGTAVAVADQDQGDAQFAPDILTVMKGHKQPVAIVAEQQTGKSRLAFAIATSWNLPGVFVGVRHQPQYHAPNWEVFTVESGDYAAGVARLESCLNNYDNMLIFLDDVTNFRDYKRLADIEPVIKLIGTQSVARNKRTLFTMHATDKDSFGLKSVGASVKNNFSLLQLDKPTRDANLHIVGYPTHATLYFGGRWSGDGHRVSLPSVTPALPATSDQGDDNGAFIRDWFLLSQNEGIRKYYKSKNGDTRQQYLDRGAALGLPDKKDAVLLGKTAENGNRLGL